MVKAIKEEIIEIYEKKFKSAPFGYNKNDVDEFLDEIADFLEKISKSLENTDIQREDVVKENIVLKAQIIKLEEKLKEQIINKKVVDKNLEKKLNKMTKEIEDIRTMKLN